MIEVNLPSLRWLGGVCLFALPWLASAQPDSLAVQQMSEVTIVSTPKEHASLRQQSLSSTSFNTCQLKEQHIDGIKDLTANVPGLFIPDYGSHLTTSIYLRGIGSRIGTPAVGLYVDNIPMADMSSMDQDFSDAYRIDVLRGPQGTLYGRNTMGGLIRVFTKSPFQYQGTDLQLSYGTYNDTRISATHYHHPIEKVAFSGSVSYHHKGGFYRNRALDGKRVDKGDDFAVRWRGIYRPSDSISVDLSVRYEKSDEGGYPYSATTGEYAGIVAYNRPSSYARHLLNIGLHAAHRFRHLDLTSSTGFQFLSDRMFMDQDFTPLDIYSLEQKQRSKSVTQEFAMKSKANRRWQWTNGVNIQYQALHTKGPVTFYQDGLDWLSQLTTSNINRYMPSISAGPMTMTFQASDLLQTAEGVPSEAGAAFPTSFFTPSLTAGIFHQSTIRRLFGAEGLSLSAGLRLDYERDWIDYDAAYSLQHTYQLSGQLTGIMNKTIPMVPATTYSIHDQIQGSLNDYRFHLMPRASLQYQWSNGNLIYATASRGYRNGGYNMQMFNELLQSNMRYAIQKDIAEATLPVMLAQPAIPAATKQQVGEMLARMAQSTEPDVASAISYKPETAWNYEIGTHLNLWDNRLKADLAAFWIDARDLQLSQMSATGMGRITINSGSSRSIGCETSLTALLTEHLTAQASYSYTHAALLHSATDEHPDNFLVPFAPAHTMGIGARYQWHTKGWAEHITLSANGKGCGRTYWDRENTFSQGFYALLDARLAVRHQDLELCIWGNNLTQTRYQAFGFITRGQNFAQLGTPCQAGITISLQL